MESVYVLVTTEPGHTEVLLKRMRSMPGVVVCDAVTGVCDIVMKLKGENIPNILTTIMGRIRKFPGVNKTETLVVVEM